MAASKTYKVHFVGIGGIGMSGIAEVLLTLGYAVSGSDLCASEATERLVRLGARVFQGHAASNLGEADAVVISSAVREDNPEVLEARRQRVPVIQRAEMLAELMRVKRSVAVAGSHGKTTTTSLVASVLAEAGLDPTMVIGGRLNSLGSNARLGRGELLVAEADESDGSFLKLLPTYAIVTNIDPEHLDHYGSFEALRTAFAEFANRVPFYGLAILCLDHPVVRGLVSAVSKRVATYGFAKDADYRALALEFGRDFVRFEAHGPGGRLGPIALRMIGEHNAQNALAVVALSEELAIPFEVVQRAMERFEGVERRFTIRGEERGVLVVDDYGHHPTEIRATLAAARRAYPERRIVAVFQPHRYTRTRDLEREFHKAFDQADALVCLDIYAAGEQPIPGVDGERLFQGIATKGPRDSCYLPRREEAVLHLEASVRPGDLVITVGAGDVFKVGRELLEKLRGRREP